MVEVPMPRIMVAWVHTYASKVGNSNHWNGLHTDQENRIALWRSASFQQESIQIQEANVDTYMIECESDSLIQKTGGSRRLCMKEADLC